MPEAIRARFQRLLGGEPGVRLALVALVLVVAASPVAALLASFLSPSMEEAAIRAVVALAGVFGVDASAGLGQTVRFEDGVFPLPLAPGQGGLWVALVLLAGLVATPASHRDRVVGAVVGVPMAVGLEIVALFALGWVGNRFMGLMITLHVFGRGLVILAAVAPVWLGWCLWVRRRPPDSGLDLRLPGRRSVLVGLAIVVALAVAGFLGGIQAYGRVIFVVANALVIAFTGVSQSLEGMPLSSLRIQFGFHYGWLALVLATFLATRSVPLGKRAKGLLAVGIPVVVTVQVADYSYALFYDAAVALEWILPGASDGTTAVLSIGTELVRTLGVALPLIGWLLWQQWTLARLEGPLSKPSSDFESWKQRQRSGRNRPLANSRVADGDE